MQIIISHQIQIKLSLLFCFVLPTCLAQVFTKNIKYQLETGGYFSTSRQTPFWLRSNQYGTVPLESQIITFSGMVHKDYDSTQNGHHGLKKFSYGYALNPVINIGKVNMLLLPEAYLKARYGVFELYCGRKKEIVGLVDTLFTSGSYIWSGNSLPMPKIQISIPNYVSVIGKGLISIKGAFSHGWFGNQNFVQNYYLHQKWLYGKIGKDTWKISFFGGFNHQVQWGGNYKQGVKFLPYQSKDGNFQNDYFAYINAVTGRSLNRLRIENKLDTSKFAGADYENRIGNHLGTIDMGVSIKIKKAKIFLYKQSIFEDGGLNYLESISDGLYGLNIKVLNDKLFQSFTIEYFNVLNQSSPNAGGLQSYLNNVQYFDGWSYNAKTIGTPLIIPQKDIPLRESKYYDRFSITNRLSTYYFATSGKIRKVNFYSKISVSNIVGIGTRDIIYSPSLRQLSYVIGVEKRHKKCTYKLNIAYDKGALFNTTGYQFTSNYKF